MVMEEAVEEGGEGRGQNHGDIAEVRTGETWETVSALFCHSA